MALNPSLRAQQLSTRLNAAPRSRALQVSMNLSKKSIADVESLEGKRVLIRVDFNVPQDKKTGAITNTQRIVGAMPTIEMALAKGAKSVVLSALRSVRTTSPGSFPIPPL